MSQEEFSQTIGRIAEAISGEALDGALAERLNQEFGAASGEFKTLATLCAEGEAEGWLMQHQAGGIKYGRALKPGSIPGGFSVDVVRMKDVRGPHHVHTTGEIGAIFPIEGTPTFDGMSGAWYVYGPGSDHHPTVEGGDAYVLYLLPDGAIEFTGK